MHDKRWDGRLRPDEGINGRVERSSSIQTGRGVIMQIPTIGIDLAKTIFY